ncbi:MAG TPA: pantoate--beta-alanine ligase [Mycobacteriales bacterium]|nr:pantoate--beta-alanine ligase [Mycobacteriales bacterium]
MKLPTVATTVEQLDEVVDGFRVSGRSVAVVMTMGALHAGHAELIRVARREAEAVVVTIFVNPLQFGPTEDLDRYPRQLVKDIDRCGREDVDVVFAPSADAIYPQPPRVTVTAGDLGDVLCGLSRPGHFDGVLTVVAKLLHLVRADVAVFGEKDAQQLALIRRMVSDLDFAVDVVGVATVREADGLAVSSRNAYLSAEERAHALTLSRALQAGVAAAADGPDAVRRAAQEVIDAAGDAVRLDYLELVDPFDLDPLTGPGEGLLAVAAHVGTTRLIDNVALSVGDVAEGDSGGDEADNEPTGITGEARTHREP